MEKKNLKRAIAKFEELANDEKYEGNRKIINLDAFLKSDIKKKKKKKDQILESTPIKSNKTDLDNDQLNNTFNEGDDSSSSEIKTADEFLKKFISQPSLIQSSTKDKSRSSSIENKSTSSKDKSINKTSKSISLLNKSPIKSKKLLLPSKSSNLNEQKNQLNKHNNRLDDDDEEDINEIENLNNQSFDDDEEDINEIENLNYQSFDDDEEDINEIENLNNQSFDDESIDPDNSELFLKAQQQQSTNDEAMTDEEQFKNNQIINLINKNQNKQICKINRLNKTINQQSKLSSDHYNSIDYITNFDYQRTATEELYELILKSDESSFTVLSKLIRNIKKTLDQDELPNPSNVKPFFHFTPDNQIHTTFLFINPKDVYYNPWNSIINKNYCNLNLLFQKIYEIIFNFNCIIKKKHQQKRKIK